MKEIQEIMLEMDNLIDKIAVDCTGCEEEKVAETKEAELAQVVPNCPPPTPIELGDFCCLISTCDFTANTQLRKAGVTYDVNCLTTKVEMCCEEDVVKYVVKVVGCIPVIANVPIITNLPNICTAGYLGDLGPAFCCSCCVCVDSEICRTSDLTLALIKANSVESKLTCTNIKISNPDVSSVDCGVKVLGTFKLNNVTRDCCSVVPTCPQEPQ